MKAKLLMFAVMAVMMAFTACTNEKIVYVEKENPLSGIELEPGEGIIKISMANTLSRAARPITDNGAANEVDRILFKFVKSEDSGGVEYDDFNVVGIVDENGDSDEKETEETGNNHILEIGGDVDKSADIYVKFSGLQEGTYRIYAFGYNSEMNSGNIPFNLSLNTDKVKYDCTLASNTEIDELFAGATGDHNGGYGVVVNQHGLFNIENNGEIKIELKRQVAALMAYMSNVPTYVNHGETGQPTKVTKITISSPKKMNGIYVPGNLLDDKWSEGNRFNGIAGVSYNPVNIYSESYENLNHLLTFDFNGTTNQDVTIVEGKNPGDYYEFEEKGKSSENTYLLADECKNTEFDFDDSSNDSKPAENTLFGSRFIFAFDGSYSGGAYATLNICYWTGSQGSEELIRCVELQGSDSKSNNSLTPDFQLRCNNFYAVGHLKTWDSNGDGDTENDTEDNEDPAKETEEEKPLDIDEAAGKDYVPISIVDEYDESLDLSNGKKDETTNGNAGI